MGYKRSIFNVFIEEFDDGRVLIYNTYSGIFGIMDTEAREIYDAIEKFGFHDSQADSAREKLTIMLKAGYIVNAAKDELTVVKLERNDKRQNNTSLALTIAPTMDCNMNCPYCYENKSAATMCDEVQRQLLAFVDVHFKVKSNLKNLRVTWYGGEPLLQKDVIYKLSEKFIRLCEENGKGYSAGLITNGVFLDVETATHLVDNCKVSDAQITVDGMREKHNARRILSNGDDSFEIVMKNIEACKDIIPINVRVNTDKDNADEIDILTKFFLDEMGWRGNPQFYLSPVEMHEINSCGLYDSLCLQGQEFADISLKSIRASYAADRGTVARSFFPTRKAVFCTGEGTDGYVIDPDGNYYNCFRHVGMAEHATGHISMPLLITEKYGEWLLTDIKEKCEKCEYLPMCMGGCALYRLNGNQEPNCFFTSFTYKGILKLAYEDYEIHKQKQHVK